MTKKANPTSDSPKADAAIPTRELLDIIYPEPAESILFQPAPIGQMKIDAMVFLDTNVLLLPYNTGKNSLADIVKIYAKLISEKRMVVPARVMQEFLKNSPDKLKEVFQKLSRQRSLNVATESYPLLESVAEYNAFLEARSELLNQLKNFQSKLGKLVDVIQDWHHDDPVKRAYGALFGPDQIVKLSAESNARLGEDCAVRYEHKIPPGYKDASKDDNGIGDLLIWKTILEVAKNQKKNGIFVCGEEKADWWHRSENQPLMVRHELIDEYRRESGGKTFRILGMADFLELFGAQHSVVEEVKEEQKTLASGARQVVMGFAIDAEKAVYDWLVARGEGPVSVLQEGGDFEVNSSNGNILVDVKVSRPENIGRRLADLYRRAANIRHMGRSFSIFMIVFVSEGESMAKAVAAQTKEWMPQFANWVSVVCGFLDATGKFVPVD